MTRKMVSSLSLLVLQAGFVALVGCGGGSGSGTQPPAGVSIGAISGPNHLQIGVVSPATYVYSASVSGSTDTAVVWSVDDSSLVTISATGGIATPSSTKTGTVTITATAHADPSKTSILHVKVVDWILAGLDVTLVDRGGSSPVTLLPATDQYANCSWAWDHLTFVCASLRVTEPTVFALFQTNGTSAGTKLRGSIDLAFGGLSYAGYPHLSPSGESIVFLGGAWNAAVMNYGIYNVAPDFSGTAQPYPTLVAADPDTADYALDSPRFSPDGTEFLYEQNGAVWISDVDGSNQHQVVAAPASNAFFSPDGTKLYYTAGDGVYVANADGANAVKLVGAGYSTVDVSPNGDSILLMDSLGFFTANSDGSNLHSVDGAGWASW